MFFLSKHKAQIAMLEERAADLEFQVKALESFIHSDAFHELIESKFDESKFDDLAQEAVERAVENADLHITVRF